MRIILMCLISLLLCGWNYPYDDYKQDTAHIFQKDHVCSGFFYKKNIVITAGHCIDRKDGPVTVYNRWGMKAPKTKILYASLPHEVAIIETTPSGFVRSLLKLDCKNVKAPRLLRPYYVLSHKFKGKPYIRAIYFRNKMSFIDMPDYVVSRMYQFFGVIESGDSGSAIVDFFGNIIGLATHSRMRGLDPYALSITAHDICDAIKKLDKSK